MQVSFFVRIEQECVSVVKLPSSYDAKDLTCAKKV